MYLKKLEMYLESFENDKRQKNQIVQPFNFSLES